MDMGVACVVPRNIVIYGGLVLLACCDLRRPGAWHAVIYGGLVLLACCDSRRTGAWHAVTQGGLPTAWEHPGIGVICIHMKKQAIAPSAHTSAPALTVTRVGLEGSDFHCGQPRAVHQQQQQPAGQNAVQEGRDVAVWQVCIRLSRGIGQKFVLQCSFSSTYGAREAPSGFGIKTYPQDGFCKLGNRQKCDAAQGWATTCTCKPMHIPASCEHSRPGHPDTNR
eukprot:1137785-Pelagomonas_calceolata.AAC.6